MTHPNLYQNNTKTHKYLTDIINVSIRYKINTTSYLISKPKTNHKSTHYLKNLILLKVKCNKESIKSISPKFMMYFYMIKINPYIWSLIIVKVEALLTILGKSIL